MPTVVQEEQESYPVLKDFPKNAGEVNAEAAESKAKNAVRTLMVVIIFF